MMWYRRLKARCEQSIAEAFDTLEEEGGFISGSIGAQHAHLNRGSNVLAVAHLDTVLSGLFQYTKWQGEEYVFTPALDDRLGVFTILDVLPRMGINVDVLLTENEERGASTASDFIPSKDYNWIVSFDRRGEGAVLYQYEGDGWRQEVEKFFTVDNGSYSDISSLEDLCCKSINVGVGYRNEHTPYCHMELSQYARQVDRFRNFFAANVDRKFPHTKQVSETAGFRYAPLSSEEYLDWWREEQEWKRLCRDAHIAESTETKKKSKFADDYDRFIIHRKKRD